MFNSQDKLKDKISLLRMNMRMRMRMRLRMRMRMRMLTHLLQGRRGREQAGPGEAGPCGAAGGRHLPRLPGQPRGAGHFLQSTNDNL